MNEPSLLKAVTSPRAYCPHAAQAIKIIPGPGGPAS